MAFSRDARMAGSNPAIVPYSELPATIQLANETAMARPDGTTTNGVTNGNGASFLFMAASMLIAACLTLAVPRPAAAGLPH